MHIIYIYYIILYVRTLRYYIMRTTVRYAFAYTTTYIGLRLVFVQYYNNYYTRSSTDERAYT